MSEPLRRPLPARLGRFSFFVFPALFFLLLSFPCVASDGLPWEEYRLSPGETATEVALRFGLSEHDLLWANDFRDENSLEAGMTLLIPESGAELLATLLEVRARDRGETTEALHVGKKEGFTFPDMNRKAFASTGDLHDSQREQAFIWPLKGKVSSPFGRRGRGFHNGIDIPAPKGTAIVAARSGRVVSAGSIRGYGRVIRIDHGNGVETLYAHCTAFLVKKGEWVRQGQKIATVGRTGKATCNHLHFTVFVDGKARDPMSYLP